MKYVIVTGGFDPIHSGHIDYITAAAKLGDRLIVGPNSDKWLERKKGRAFMKYDERAYILRSIKEVYDVVSYDDDCGDSSELVKFVMSIVDPLKDEVIFANGGDRNNTNVAEMALSPKYPNLKFAFGVGGDSKRNSSRWILEKWSHEREERPWGRYDILKNYPGCKVKEIKVNSNSCLSYQRHNYRSELWFVVSGHGRAIVNGRIYDLVPQGYVEVEQGHWHQLINGSSEPLHIIEIQFGEKCEEADIERDNNEGIHRQV